MIKRIIRHIKKGRTLDENPERLIGEAVEVRVVRKSNEKAPVFLVLEKFYGKISFIILDDGKYKKRVEDAIDKLTNGKIIHCEVVGFDLENQLLELYWSVAEIEATMDEIVATATIKSEKIKANNTIDDLKILGKINLSEINSMTAKEATIRNEAEMHQIANEIEDAIKEVEDIKEKIKKESTINAISEVEKTIWEVVRKAEELVERAKEISKKTITKSTKKSAKKTLRTKEKIDEIAERVTEITKKKIEKIERKAMVKAIMMSEWLTKHRIIDNIDSATFQRLVDASKSPKSDAESVVEQKIFSNIEADKINYNNKTEKLESELVSSLTFRDNEDEK